LIEQTPPEEAWEIVLDILSKQISEATPNSWLRPLQVVNFENGTLTYRAPTKLIGEWVESHYAGHMKRAWEAVGDDLGRFRLRSGT